VKEVFTVLIDDDPLVRITWKMAAERRGIPLKVFSRVEEFEKFKAQLDFSSLIYIDSQLDDGVRGEEIARQLSGEGFTQIYLATGFDPSEFEGYRPFLKGIIGKEPPF